LKKLLILSDGRPGHFNQSLAVAEAIKGLYGVEVTYINIKVKRLAKYFLRILLNSTIRRQLFGGKFSLKIIQMFYGGYEWVERPDIIISAGKDTSLLNAMLALMHGSKNFFIGYPKKLDNHLFTSILTVLDLGFDNQIVLDVAPTRPYDGDLMAFTTRYNLDPHYKYYTLLIGGDGSGYKFDEEDIEQLITFVNSTADKVKWLITTSRRTAASYEGKMEKEMQAECFIAFNKNPQKVVAGFLELSSAVFVTEESASMVSEAIASKNPVVTLVPKYHNSDKNYQKILQKFSTEKRIQRIEISKLENFEIDLGGFNHLEAPSVFEIALKLKEKFKEIR